MVTWDSMSVIKKIRSELNSSEILLIFSRSLIQPSGNKLMDIYFSTYTLDCARKSKQRLRSCSLSEHSGIGVSECRGSRTILWMNWVGCLDARLLFDGVIVRGHLESLLSLKLFLKSWVCFISHSHGKL